MLLEFDRRQSYCKAYSKMIARDAVKDSSTILNPFMEGGGARKDVVHAWNSSRVMGGGKACVSCIFVRSVLEESILHT